jgi:hypothetical protein
MAVNVCARVTGVLRRFDEFVDAIEHERALEMRSDDLAGGRAAFDAHLQERGEPASTHIRS